MHRPYPFCFLFGLGMLASLSAQVPAALSGPRAVDALRPAGADGGPATAAELRTQFEAILNHPRFRGALWGVKVVSLASGNVLVEHDADRLLSPASNTKLFTAALALDRLGSGHRIETTLFTTSPIEADGTVRGDLVIEGRGDPSWNPRRSGGAFGETFSPVVEMLRKAGVKRITGDIVADASYFRTPPQGAGWTADDLDDYYGAEVSAISLDENYADLKVQPGTVLGQPCVVTCLQPGTGLTFENRTVTGAVGTPRTIRVRRWPGERVVWISGGLPLAGNAEIEAVSVPRPADWYATSLVQALKTAGIGVDGRVRSVRWPEASVRKDTLLAVGRLTSPPMAELVSVMMKVSQNLRAHLLLDYVGELRRMPETPAERTSEELAVDELGAFLAENGVPVGDVRFEEGSGLSRNNLTTADTVVRLLQTMAVHREARAFEASLPVAGVDGTLRSRMKGTVAEGRVQAKTGTLRWANGLSGYVTCVGGGRLAFSFLLNRHRATEDRSARVELDALAVILAGYRGR